jgi:hypothetical protein
MLGPRALSMGLGAVGLVMPKPWVIGTLARQLWAVAGPNQNVNQTLVQAFQLQHAVGLVCRKLADHHRQLERAARAALECSDRRRRRQIL